MRRLSSSNIVASIERSRARRQSTAAVAAAALLPAAAAEPGPVVRFAVTLTDAKLPLAISVRRVNVPTNGSSAGEKQVIVKSVTPSSVAEQQGAAVGDQVVAVGEATEVLAMVSALKSKARPLRLLLLGRGPHHSRSRRSSLEVTAAESSWYTQQAASLDATPTASSVSSAAVMVSTSSGVVVVPNSNPWRDVSDGRSDERSDSTAPTLAPTRAPPLAAQAARHAREQHPGPSSGERQQQQQQALAKETHEVELLDAQRRMKEMEAEMARERVARQRAEEARVRDVAAAIAAKDEALAAAATAQAEVTATRALARTTEAYHMTKAAQQRERALARAAEVDVMHAEATAEAAAAATITRMRNDVVGKQVAPPPGMFTPPTADADDDETESSEISLEFAALDARLAAATGTGIETGGRRSISSSSVTISRSSSSSSRSSSSRSSSSRSSSSSSSLAPPMPPMPLRPSTRRKNKSEHAARERGGGQRHERDLREVQDEGAPSTSSAAAYCLPRELLEKLTSNEVRQLRDALDVVAPSQQQTVVDLLNAAVCFSLGGGGEFSAFYGTYFTCIDFFMFLLTGAHAAACDAPVSHRGEAHESGTQTTRRQSDERDAVSTACAACAGERDAATTQG